MLSVASALLSRLAPTEAISRRDAFALAVITVVHMTALVVMAATELDLATKATFLLAWALLNFFWLALLRRPAIAGFLSLAMIIALILLSQFKYDKLMMTVNFVDLMIIDPDTSAFLFTVMPQLREPVLIGLAIAAPVLMLLWRIDPFRVRIRTTTLGSTLCMGGLVALSAAYPADLYGEFFSRDYVSKFARSGVEAIYEFATYGLLELDATVSDRLKAPAAGCSPGGKLPHIILLHDEFELRHHRCSWHESSAGLSTAFSIVRWRGAQDGGGRRWRSQLVYRIQCTDRAVRAFLRTLCDIGDTYCSRPRRARATECTHALRLQDFQPLSILRRISGLAWFSDDGGH